MRELSQSALQLYGILERYAAVSVYKFGLDYCWPGQVKLAEELGRTTRHVRRLLRELERAGCLKVRRPNRQKSARYYLAARPSGFPAMSAQEVPDRTLASQMSARNGPERTFLPSKCPVGSGHSCPVSPPAPLEESISKQQQPAAAAENLLIPIAAELLYGAGLSRSDAEHRAGENPALGIVAAEYFRELQGRKGRQPPQIGLLVRFLQQPLERDFERLSEAPTAPLTAREDAYRVWHPPRDSTWYRRRRAVESQGERRKRQQAQAAAEAERRARDIAERQRNERLWAALPADEAAAIRAAVQAEYRLPAPPDPALCHGWLNRWLQAQADRERYELYGPDDVARFERHAAAAYPVFFASERTRIAAVLMAADYIERQDRRERRPAEAR